jgi:sugar lactone lactonase YvrE
VATVQAEGQTVPVFLNQWGTLGSGPGQFQYPYGVTVASDGTVYVTDQYNYRIEAFGPTGDFLRSWGSAGSGPGQFGKDIGITTDLAGNVYAADWGNNRVQVFTRDGVFVRQFANGDLSPRDIAVGPNGNVFVTGYTAGSPGVTTIGSEVYVYDPSGRFLYGIGHYPTPIETISLAFAPDGTLWVADPGYLTQHMADSGDVLQTMSLKSISPTFQSTGGICVLPSGTLCVADYDGADVMMITPSGGLIGTFGMGHVSSAADVNVGPDGSMYVVDLKGCRIARFGQAATPTRFVSWGTVKAGFRR